MRKVGLGETGNIDSTGGGITQGVGNFLQGGGAGHSIVWVRDVGPFGGNGVEGRGDTHEVPATDHRALGESVSRREMGDADGQKAYERQRERSRRGST